jgi:hypothetical protein
LIDLILKKSNLKTSKREWSRGLEQMDKAEIRHPAEGEGVGMNGGGGRATRAEGREEGRKTLSLLLRNSHTRRW